MTGRERSSSSVALLALGFAAIALSRAPQALGGQLFADADESIVALMAKHLVDRGEVSFVFWGQSYGLAIFESAAAAAAFRLFGFGDLALKGALLFLWTIGWCFHVLAVNLWAGRRAAVIAAVALIVFPGWAILSMKAFGGPVTAFMFTGFVLWLVAREETSPAPGSRAARAARTILLGACAGVIFLAHPLWLLPNLPVIARLRVRRRLRDDAVGLASGLLILLLAVGLATLRFGSSHWTPEVLSGIAPARALLNLPVNLTIAASGAHWMDRIIVAGSIARAAGILWLAAWIAAALWARAHRWPQGLGTLLLAGALPAAATLALRAEPFQFRYLAPALAPFTLCVAIAAAAKLAAGIGGRALIAAALAVLFAASSAALVETRRLPNCGLDIPPGMTVHEAFGALLRRLDDEGIHDVYSADAMLQWNVIWQSRERIIARYKHPIDRFPEYPAAVDRALFAGQRVAIVGRADQAPALAAALRAAGQLRDPIIVAGSFSLILDPGIDVIRRVGFRLNDGPGR